MGEREKGKVRPISPKKKTPPGKKKAKREREKEEKKTSLTYEILAHRDVRRGRYLVIRWCAAQRL